jgi:alanyl-tRNA synthetase
MTDRLYYHNSFLYDFVAALEGVRKTPDGRTAVVLDRTTFYPTSGGQVFDTGWLELEPLESERGKFLPKLRVTEVAEEEGGAILHFVEGEVPPGPVRARGFIDVERRRDHMQQHSGQHILSAAFVELFQMSTVSFHMGEESCTIDLDTKALTAEQVRKAEQRANDVILEDRAVSMQFVSPEKAREMGLRKLPPAERAQLRLIGIENFDLCACGGTHVRSTGQVGIILCRKIEKAKQGFRVEFVCGERALRTARRDYETLTEAAGLLSAHMWDVSAQIKRQAEELRSAGKSQQKLLEEIAELRASQLVAETPEQNGFRLVAQVLRDRDLAFAKLLAQKLTREPGTVAVLGAAAGQPVLVLAQTPGMKFDMGALMKETMTALGARGGGSKDLAQGGVPDASKVEAIVQQIADKLRGSD